MSKPLSFSESEKLNRLLKEKKLNSAIIARQNGLKTKSMIFKAINGEYPITPRIKELFLNCGIDLEVILDEHEF
jgi:hypothetical protein